MKILLINTWFDFGSTGKIVKSIYDKLTKTGIDAYVIYGRGKKQKLQNVSRSSSKIECMLCSLLSRFTRDIYGGAYFSTKRIIKKINEIKPDLINVHCTNSFYVNNKELFTYIGKSGINTVLTLHAEFQYTGNCTHTYDCQKYITGCHDCVRHR
jgi:putative colanic acid biosynthesis glycosyltransferase